MRPETEQLWKKLTKDEKTAAFEYTAGSGKFNRPLRGYDKSWDNNVGVGKVPLNNEGAGQMIGDLQSAIGKSGLKQDMWLYRGSDQQSLAGMLKVDKGKITLSNVESLNRKFAGSRIQDNAFVSTGVAADAGFSDKVAYEILAPKGTRGIYAEPFSAFGGTNNDGTWNGVSKSSYVSGEAEMIFQAGTQFRLLEIKEVGGKLTAVLEVIT